MSCCYVQVLSIDAPDSSPCIVIGTATQRFLFESGEGTQRLCLEHKVKLSRLHTIFITQLCSSRITGLPGLMLTTADIGKTSLNIVGPIGIKQAWNTTRYFYNRPNFHLTIIESNSINQITQLNSDELKVSSIPITNPIKNDIRLCYICETYKSIGKFDVAKAVALNVPKGPLFGKLKNGQSITLDDGTIIKPEDVLDPEIKGRYALVLCDLSDISDSSVHYLESCIKNPYWRRFQIGGDEIDLVDCIVHMSSVDILTSSSYQSWMMLFGDNVEHMFVGRGACEPHSSFIASTKYINKLNKVSPIFQSLSLSNGLKYQRPKDDDKLEVKIIPSKPLTKFNMLPSRTRGYVYSTEGNDTINEEVNLVWEDAKTNTKTESLMAEIENVQKAVQSTIDSNFADKNPLVDVYDLDSEQAKMCLNYGDNRIWFLGTGSAMPSKYRNVSGILFQIAHTKSSILLDVGEGTWQQMMKMALNCPSLLSLETNINVENVDSDLIGYELSVQVKAAWISHPHADHHLGLIRLLSERKRLLLKYGNNDRIQPLVLIAPASVLSFIRDYEAVDSYLKDSYLPLSTRMFDSFDNCLSEDSFWSRRNKTFYQDPTNSNGCEIVEESVSTSETSFLSLPFLKSKLQQGTLLLKNMGIESISNVKVVHCNESYGVAVTLVKYGDLQLKPFTIVYSGDTRPCRKLTELGQGATVLIHEATFDDTKEDEAKSKRHSTIKEALSIASDMKVFRVILTHFSQRYPKVPPMPATLQTKTVLAFDYMHVSLKELLWAPSTVPALSEALPSEEDDDDDIDCTTNPNCNCLLNCGECKVQTNTKKVKRNNDDMVNKKVRKLNNE